MDRKQREEKSLQELVGPPDWETNFLEFLALGAEASSITQQAYIDELLRRCQGYSVRPGLIAALREYRLRPVIVEGKARANIAPQDLKKAHLFCANCNRHSSAPASRVPIQRRPVSEQKMPQKVQGDQSSSSVPSEEEYISEGLCAPCGISVGKGAFAAYTLQQHRDGHQHRVVVEHMNGGVAAVREYNREHGVDFQFCKCCHRAIQHHQEHAGTKKHNSCRESFERGMEPERKLRGKMYAKVMVEPTEGQIRASQEAYNQQQEFLLRRTLAAQVETLARSTSSASAGPSNEELERQLAEARNTERSVLEEINRRRLEGKNN
jgi:hypothetical protein